MSRQYNVAIIRLLRHAHGIVTTTYYLRKYAAIGEHIILLSLSRLWRHCFTMLTPYLHVAALLMVVGFATPRHGWYAAALLHIRLSKATSLPFVAAMLLLFVTHALFHYHYLLFHDTLLLSLMATYLLALSYIPYGLLFITATA